MFNACFKHSMICRVSLINAYFILFFLFVEKNVLAYVFKAIFTNCINFTVLQQFLSDLHGIHDWEIFIYTGIFKSSNNLLLRMLLHHEMSILFDRQVDTELKLVDCHN